MVKMFKKNVALTIDSILKALKFTIFASLICGAGVMYASELPQWGNDLLLTAGLFLALNKLDVI